MSRRARARARAKRAHSRRQVLGERQEAERCHAETSVACCVCGGRIRGALCWSRNGPAHWGCQQQGHEPVAKHIWRHGGPKIWRRCRFWWSPSLRRSVRRARRRLRFHRKHASSNSLQQSVLPLGCETMITPRVLGLSSTRLGGAVRLATMSTRRWRYVLPAGRRLLWRSWKGTTQGLSSTPLPTLRLVAPAAPAYCSKPRIGHAKSRWSGCCSWSC